LRRYVHLGTGNYHVRTARGYTDVGYLTCDRQIGEDVHRLFLQLTGLGRTTRLGKIVQSPFGLHRFLLAAIEAEAAAARAGKPSRIVAKMNALTDPQMIQALYAASQAGVPIDLIVRGTCCLRPGVPGVSETIRVRSIVGRFLEHERVFYFLAGGAERIACSSADWMPRNLYRRVETCFPVEERRHAQRLMAETIEPYLDDNAQAWLLQSDGTYVRAKPGKQPRRAAQEVLLERLCETPESEPAAEANGASSEKRRIAAAVAVEEKLRRARRGAPADLVPPSRRRRKSRASLEPIVPPARRSDPPGSGRSAAG
jgi:polyphosphate kinase